MTQEEKAKAYDEAIKRAKNCLDEKRDTCLVRPDVIFPELQESEDEKIRKMLIKFFCKGAENDSSTNGISDKDIVAWLEKQGEQPQGKTALEAAKEEKVDNQNCAKPADKVEPKFNIGDWITNGEYTWKVKDIKSLDYILQSQDGHIVDDTISYVDYNFRLWTIKDAKDGDVLVCNCKRGQEIGIVKKYIGKYGGCDICFETYCFVDWNGIFRVFEYIGSRNIYPATKEQRDDLIKTMNDAGYTFDFKKKELKKIPNSFEECKIVHVEHGKYYYCIKDYFCGGKKQASKGDVVQALRGMSMMALGVKANEYFMPVNTIKQKPAWSEEDRKRIQRISDFIWKNRKGDTDEIYQQEQDVKWLKSLRHRSM